MTATPSKATEPLLIKAMRRRPSGKVEHLPDGLGRTGTSARGFLAEVDEWVEALVAERISALADELNPADGHGVWPESVSPTPLGVAAWLRSRAALTGRSQS